MVELRELVGYSDDRGNRVVFDGEPHGNVKITFRGENNTLTVATNAKIGQLNVSFDCDNGDFSLGGNTGVPAFSAHVRIGQDSTVHIGSNVSTTAICSISATEGTSVTLGDDVMLASQNQIRADDGHAIYDVVTDLRVNVSRSIMIGNHVWVGYGVAVLGGVTVGDGSVLGIGSIVTKSVPNNCVAAGNPARVVRRNTAWERPHLSLKRPYYKPDARSIAKSPYWNVTDESTASATATTPRISLWRRAAVKLRRLGSRVAARLRK